MYLVAILLAVSLLMTSPVTAQNIVAVMVDDAPMVDGRADDSVWSLAKAVTIADSIAAIEVTLKAVYADDAIFFLVSFPDATENREHKTMLWDAQEQMYRMGPKREDMFVVKWSMEPQPVVDLSISADRPYRADIWFWKAYRTDHAGYADDKSHTYSITPIPQSKKVFSKGGKVFYLFRPGDEGAPAYHPRVYERYVGDSVPRYAQVQPAGSRADVRASGRWQDGVWTIEFGRKLVTGHADDVQLKPSKRYLLGISRFEIAGRDRDPDVEQPDYGMGDVTEILTLLFQHSPGEP